ncbi:MAG: helix-hairpin-helix domain-containing protein [Eubacterium sp.]|nr:helix-hairpin-helix domain-containing protein [Eubacterium sp.]
MYYRLKRLIKDAENKNILLITAAAAIILAAAVFFIYYYGNSENISFGSLSDPEDQIISETENSSNIDPTSNIYVDISGCVKKPGVYEMEPGSRIFEVIDEAGGFTRHADTALINQAEEISDGMKINVPDKRDKGKAKSSGHASASSDTSESLININKADSETLQRIPGIGPVTAEKIIQYREENGPFGSVEDITNISGIGDKTLEKMRPSITV